VGGPNFHEEFMFYLFSRLQQSDCQFASYIRKINSQPFADLARGALRTRGAFSRIQGLTTVGKNDFFGLLRCSDWSIGMF
jgi:hypothetical protein